MRKLQVLLAGVAAGGLMMVAGSRPAPAQDPAVVNAKMVSVKLDNAHVRVLDSVLQPGDKEQMHSHPAAVIYVVSGGKMRNHLADGKTSEAEVKAGDVIYRDAVTHWSENIGTTPVHVVLVELKNPS